MSVELTTPQVAEFYGVTTKTVQNWIASGLPINRKGGPGKPHIFRSVDVHLWLIDREVASRVVSSGDAGSFDKSEEEGRLKHHQANIEQMKEAEKRGELIPLAEAIEDFGELVANARAKILLLPKEVPKKYRERLTDAIRKSLDELSQPAA